MDKNSGIRRRRFCCGNDPFICNKMLGLIWPKIINAAEEVGYVVR
jgi:hypothetical protein